MSKTIRLGTRGSLLAVTQSQIVADSLTAATGLPVELIKISTKGDRVTDRPLQEVGGKGLFTKEIEDSLLSGDIDFAVHSMKDMPTEGPEGLTIHCVPKRVDPRDALIGGTFSDLPKGARVGTGSVRRQLQIHAVRPDIELLPIRGNVDTRIGKLRSGEYDAIVLACAGIIRLGRGAEIDDAFSVDVMIPAVGQGALALQCRDSNQKMKQILDTIHHEKTALTVACERAFLTEISGGCSAPAACHAWFEGNEVVAVGIWAEDERSAPKRIQLRCDPLHVHAMGRQLAISARER